MLRLATSSRLQSKLSFKLLGVFFLILCIATGAVLLSRYLWNKSFDSFIHKMENDRVGRIVKLMEQTYKAHNSWQGIAEDQALLDRLVDQAVKIRPQPLRRENINRFKLVPLGWPMDIFLLDANHHPIVGCAEHEEHNPLIPLTVNGAIVGWLGQHEEPHETEAAAALVVNQNRQMFWLAGGVVLLTTAIALLFSCHLLSPIRQLISGTKQLANREFNVRVPVVTKDELGQLAVNFNTMAQSLETYETMHRLWLTDISHDLRAPLALLRGEIEAIQDGIRHVSSDCMSSLHEEVDRISTLVEDLHLIFMMDSNSLKLNFQLINPFAVIKTITKGYVALLARRQIELVLEIKDIKDTSIEGDAGRLIQVFSNIFDNTYKYVQSPGVVKVTAQTDPSSIFIRVQDSGPGVSDADLPRLFDRLYRAAPPLSNGSGLGLSICSRIINQHGGAIWAEKSPLGGLSVCMQLPLSKSAKEESA